MIRQIQAKGKLCARFLKADDLYLAIFRKPEMGRPLDEKRSQVVEFVSSPAEILRNRKRYAEEDLILVPLASLASKLRNRLDAQRGGNE